MGWLRKTLKKVWDVFRKITATFLVVMAVFFVFVAIVGGTATVGPFAAVGYAILTLAAAYILDGDTTNALVNRVGEAVSNFAERLGELVADVIESVARGLGIPEILLWLAGGYGLFVLFSGKREEQNAAR